MRLRAVFFDIGDTLWHEALPELSSARGQLGQAGAAAWAERNGIAAEDPALVARAAWAALTAARAEARRTDLVEPDAAAVAREALRGLGITISSSQAHDLLDAIYVSGPASGKALYADALPVLEELQLRGYLLGMITNRAFGGPRFRADLRALGLTLAWDVEVVSAEAGYMKPHPAIFQAALKAAALAPAESLMVGDSLADDVAGAQAVGMMAAWRRCPPDAEGVEPDFAFDELRELLALPGLRRAAS